MTYSQLWRQLTPLYDEGEAKAIVRLVMEERFGISLTDLLCGAAEEMGEAEKNDLEGVMARLSEGEPVQYVLGQAVFMGRAFHVEKGVLVPRPETEMLCRWVLDEGMTPGCRVLDIGCGSGCIAVTLALEGDGAEVTAWDISPKALEVTEGNARRFGVKVSTERVDILERAKASSPDGAEVWDVVVSNPPYICKREAVGMHPNVLGHEPHEALFVPDGQPLLFYEAIAQYSSLALKAGGKLFFECNPAHLSETAEMLRQKGYSDVTALDDPFGKTRFLKAVAPSRKNQPS